MVRFAVILGSVRPASVGAPVARYSISFPTDGEDTRNENPMITPSAMTVKNMP